MYVFISNCVKEKEPADAAAVAAKLEVVRALEAAGCGVFDYRERPGSAPTWMEDIRQHILNSGCMIYFAKRWPEPDPGVCLIELGAAKINSLPIYIFSLEGYKKEVPIFNEYSSRLADALTVAQGLVFKEVAPLVERIQRRASESKSVDSPFVLLTTAFVRGGALQPASNLDQTSAVLTAILDAMVPAEKGGLGLRRIKTQSSHPGTFGYWRIPALSSVIALRDRGPQNGSILSHYTFSDGAWLNSGDFSATESPQTLLDAVYSLGPVLHDDQVCLLCWQSGKWRLLGRKLDLQLEGPAGLESAIRRTCLSRFAGGRCGFFADGEFFEIITTGATPAISKAPAPDVLPDEYYSPPGTQAPARIAPIAGGAGLTALLHRGRAEAILRETFAGAILHSAGDLHLGLWEEIPVQDLLRCFRINGTISMTGAYPGFTQVSATEPPAALGCYWRCLQKLNPNYTIGCGTYFNGAHAAPVLLEVDLAGTINPFCDPVPAAGVHQLDLKWCNELREKLRKVISPV